MSDTATNSQPVTVVELDYEIVGHDFQFIEFFLDPSQLIIAEAGSMLYCSESIEINTRLTTPGSGGVFNALWSAGKRLLSGENLFLMTFRNRAERGKARVALAAAYPGKIVALNLAELGTMLSQKHSYLCSSAEVQFDIAFTKRMGAGIFGGEGFILQKLSGEGLAFVHAGGAVHTLQLEDGESIKVDTGCLVAFQETVDYSIEFIGGVKSALFGGEGLFLIRLTGPGLVVLQSLPFARFVDKIDSSLPSQIKKRARKNKVKSERASSANRKRD